MVPFQNGTVSSFLLLVFFVTVDETAPFSPKHAVSFKWELAPETH
jgi:hypothetical protein